MSSLGALFSDGRICLNKDLRPLRKTFSIFSISKKVSRDSFWHLNSSKETDLLPELAQTWPTENLFLLKAAGSLSDSRLGRPTARPQLTKPSCSELFWAADAPSEARSGRAGVEDEDEERAVQRAG